MVYHFFNPRLWNHMWGRIFWQTILGRIFLKKILGDTKMPENLFQKDSRGHENDGESFSKRFSGTQKWRRIFLNKILPTRFLRCFQIFLKKILGRIFFKKILKGTKMTDNLFQKDSQGHKNDRESFWKRFSGTQKWQRIFWKKILWCHFYLLFLSSRNSFTYLNFSS